MKYKLKRKKYKFYTFHIVQCVSQHFKLSKIKRVTECFIIEICISSRLKKKSSNLLDSKLSIFHYIDKEIFLFQSCNCFPPQCKQAFKPGTRNNFTAFSPLLSQDKVQPCSAVCKTQPLLPFEEYMCVLSVLLKKIMRIQTYYFTETAKKESEAVSA